MIEQKKKTKTKKKKIVILNVKMLMQNAFHITSKNTWQMIVKIKKEEKEEIIKLIKREIHSERNKKILKIFNIHS